MKDSQKIYLRGNSERGDEVIRILKKLGGGNIKHYYGNNNFGYYYINPYGKINFASKKESIYPFLREFYKEISLPRWKPKNNETYYRITWIGEVAEDIWYGSRNDESGYKFGNVFKTRKEAELARDKIRNLLNNEQ